MANPTTAFGWVMPNSADLVTDLPADFAVFGQGVDTSMQFLLGGTTGQVLSKTSATNMAFTWIANDTGDITGVTAGTGISGGGTSGTVTVTNDMATAITTNGDLIRGTGSGTFARLGIGSTSQVLTVAGGIPSWATPASTAFSGCLYGKTTNQTLANGTTTLITFANTATYDTDSYHSISVNNTRFTAPTGKTGYYWIYGQINYDSNSTGYRTFSLKKNNGTADFIFTNGAGTFTANNNFYMILSLTAGDYLEITGQQGSGGNLDVLGSTYGTRATYFGMQYLGA